MSRRALVATAAEVAALVSRLESTRCEPWHVRRYLADLKPAVEDGYGRTMLYTIDDVCLVRLAVQLEREGLSACVVRAVLANHAETLGREWRQDGNRAFVVHGVRGALVDGRELRDLPAGYVGMSLRAIRHGVADQIARIRRDTPTVPLFNRHVPVREVLRTRLALAGC